MTDIKKAGKRAGAEKAKKLQLNKETLKDLGAQDPGQIRGGLGANKCTQNYSGCTQSGE